MASDSRPRAGAPSPHHQISHDPLSYRTNLFHQRRRHPDHGLTAVEDPHTVHRHHHLHRETLRKTFTTPVMYFKRGDTATIRVESPDRKKWWRNFLDDGAPITLELPGGTLTGQATTCRHARSTTAPATPSTRT